MNKKWIIMSDGESLWGVNSKGEESKKIESQGILSMELYEIENENKLNGVLVNKNGEAAEFIMNL